MKQDQGASRGRGDTLDGVLEKESGKDNEEDAEPSSHSHLHAIGEDAEGGAVRRKVRQTAVQKAMAARSAQLQQVSFNSLEIDLNSTISKQNLP